MPNDIEVLVLDDEKIVCERLQKHLLKKKYKVETFTEGQKALERLNEKIFDVVITDLKMAGASGIDVLINIKEKDIPTQVIIITGFPSYESATLGEYKDMFAYVTKPFKMNEIEKIVAKAAKKARKIKPTLMDKLKDSVIKRKMIY